MAKASKAIELTSSADEVWRVVTDFVRYPEWLAIHKQWITEAPSGMVPGDEFQQEVVLLGPPAVVSWTVASVEPGTALEWTGTAPMGVEARLSYRLAAIADGTELTMELEFNGGPVTGPIGDLIQDAAHQQIDKSLVQVTELMS